MENQTSQGMAPSRVRSTRKALVTGNPKWDMMYHHLVDYKRKFHNCLVPNRYKELPQLGSWVSTQRRHYKLLQAGQDSPLTQERLNLLNQIGFVWATKDPRHVSFIVRLCYEMVTCILCQIYNRYFLGSTFLFDYLYALIGTMGTKVSRAIALQRKVWQLPCTSGL